MLDLSSWINTTPPVHGQGPLNTGGKKKRNWEWTKCVVSCVYVELLSKNGYMQILPLPFREGWHYWISSTGYSCPQDAINGGASLNPWNIHIFSGIWEVVECCTDDLVMLGHMWAAVLHPMWISSGTLYAATYYPLHQLHHVKDTCWHISYTHPRGCIITFMDEYSWLMSSLQCSHPTSYYKPLNHCVGQHYAIG